MGNCAGNPKTNEGDAPVPVPEEAKVEQPETKTEETPLGVSSDDKSLGTLLNENGEKKEEVVEAKEEEVKKSEEVKAEEKVEEVKKKEEEKVEVKKEEEKVEVKKEEEGAKPETKEEKKPAIVEAQSQN